MLFSDIVGYTSMSSSVNTADVFDMLNQLYTAFDALCDQHGVYKVDTIGDGLPPPIHTTTLAIPHNPRSFFRPSP